MPPASGRRRVRCRCGGCGVEKYVSVSSLDEGGTSQCARCAGAADETRLSLIARDLTGEIFGTYVIVGDPSSTRTLERKLTARCGCGVERVMRAKEFVGAKGSRKRCVACSNRHRRHVPDEAWELRQIYDQVIARCTDPRSSNWNTYGGRGIRVCDEWRGKDGLLRFARYIVDAIGRRPSKTHTLDRVDGRLGYQPGNLRWSTPKEQAANRRKPMPVQPRGITRQAVHAELKLAYDDRIVIPKSLLTRLWN